MAVGKISVACLLVLFALAPAYSKQPNIVFIVADDLGWNDVGWRNPDVLTPNMNKLAMEGVILDASYVQPVCSPSRGALMSGYYPFHTGLQTGVIFPQQPYGLPLNFTILPQKLKELGYSTHIVGKWHLGFCNWDYTPTHRGFDTFYGRYTGAQDYYSHMRDQGLDFRFNKDVVRDQDGVYSLFSFTNRVEAVIKEHETSKPLFIYVPYQSVHTPLQVPQKYEDMYKHISGHWRRKYLGMVTAMDEAIGKIVDALKTKGLADNTLIVFTTDNGGPEILGAANNWPLRGGKTTLWEGGTRGAAFAWGNMLKQKQYINTEMIHLVDWFPTLVAAAGGTPDPRMDGVNQWATVSENAPSARKEMVLNIDEIRGYSAIRIGDYKLVDENPIVRLSTGYQLGDDPTLEALYNIVEDPSEADDMSSRRRSLVVQMKERLKFHIATIYPSLGNTESSPAGDPKNWGYVWSPGWC